MYNLERARAFSVRSSTQQSLQSSTTMFVFSCKIKICAAENVDFVSAGEDHTGM